ncbi:hypothetical protein [Streptomyces sp. NPDC052291]|uniref:TRADD-N-associated membrane domain-containing protein n=1 Tax=Streptomyces sp. NPDC052291 TaxID=3161011 RepID=UPI00341F5F7F
MSTSNENLGSRRPGDDRSLLQRASLRALYICFGAMITGITVCSLALDDKKATNSVYAIGFCGVLAIFIFSWILGRTGFFAGSVEIDESRYRLTQAEDRLTEALRRQISTDRGAADFHTLVDDLRPPPVDEGAEPGEPARTHGALALPELWHATHARLGLYHDIATGQAKVSFRNAQRSMWAGFGLLIVFAGLAAWASTTAGVIVAGGLGATAGALAGFVSRTFIRSQEAAASHLRSYFDQPLELSRYLAAERLVAGADLTREQRGAILSALVQTMVAGPTPVHTGGTVPAQPEA